MISSPLDIVALIFIILLVIQLLIHFFTPDFPYDPPYDDYHYTKKELEKQRRRIKSKIAYYDEALSEIKDEMARREKQNNSEDSR